MPTQLGKILIVLGLLIVVAGVVLVLAGRIPWLGRLPGDIHIRRKGVDIYIPLATSLLISVILTVILWLIAKAR